MHLTGPAISFQKLSNTFLSQQAKILQDRADFIR